MRADDEQPLRLCGGNIERRRSGSRVGNGRDQLAACTARRFSGFMPGTFSNTVVSGARPRASSAAIFSHAGQKARDCSSSNPLRFPASE